MAKVRAHCIFSAGSIAALFAYLKVGPSMLMLGLLTAVATDSTIDILGHRRKYANPPSNKKHIYVRSRLTHSILTAPLWGMAWGYIIAKIAATIKDYLMTKTIKTNFLLLMIAGFIVSICHLFTDSFSEGGVYLPFKRYRLMELPYDHWGLNLSLVAVGVVGLMYAALAMIKL